jgi:hypothetical protein
MDALLWKFIVSNIDIACVVGPIGRSLLTAVTPSVRHNNRKSDKLIELSSQVLDINILKTVWECKAIAHVHCWDNWSERMTTAGTEQKDTD